jgi:hypothetical protein
MGKKRIGTSRPRSSGFGPTSALPPATRGVHECNMHAQRDWHAGGGALHAGLFVESLDPTQPLQQRRASRPSTSPKAAPR